MMETEKGFTVSSILIIVVLSAIVLGGGGYIASQTIFKSEEAPNIFDPEFVQEPVEKPAEVSVQKENPTQQQQSQDPEIVIADKLSTCTPHKVTSRNVLTGDMLQKEVVGIVNGKCHYVEELPNNGKLECGYSENERVAVANYYRLLAGVLLEENVSIGFKIDSTGEKTFTFNGKQVENPLQEAVDNGACVVSGY